LASPSPFKDLVEYIVRSLVDYPEEVSVTEVDGPGTIIIEVHVAESDMGRVIGRRGSVVSSIRTLAQVLGAKEGKRVTLEIL